jgi:probable O-glycosylation ligase (exosortase A-associated)
MNPHRMGWGPAYNFQFSMIVGAVTILATIFSGVPKKLPTNVAVFFLILFIIWCSITTYFALVPDSAMNEWKRFIKIQVMVLICLILINDFKKLNQFLWVVVGSIGYFGVKGGIFTILTGGSFMVLGPPDSFISGNTEIGFALVIIFPLIWYFYLSSNRKWVRRVFIGIFVLTALAIVGTTSRGAFVAGGIVSLFLWIKNKNRVRNALFLLLLIVLVLSFMPKKFFTKMETIKTYEEDASAMGRINAWWFAYHLANDRPIMGGGFHVFTPRLFPKYAPNPEDYHDAHSIYFEVLGEQGYIGLILFLILGLSTWRNASQAIKLSKDQPELKAQNHLAGMLQVSLVAYASGGAFLGLAYFDLPYHLVAVAVILRTCIEQKVQEGFLDSAEISQAPIS